MTLRPYRTVDDYFPLKGWLKNYDKTSDLADELPDIGLMVTDEDGKIAAGFLRRVEGGFFLMDSLIANPESSGKRRYQAIDLLVQGLLAKARELGLKKVLAFTRERAILKRSVKHGFRILDHVVIGISISEGGAL